MFYNYIVIYNTAVWARQAPLPISALSPHRPRRRLRTGNPALPQGRPGCCWDGPGALASGDVFGPALRHSFAGADLCRPGAAKLPVGPRIHRTPAIPMMHRHAMPARRRQPKSVHRTCTENGNMSDTRMSPVAAAGSASANRDTGSAQDRISPSKNARILISAGCCSDASSRRYFPRSYATNRRSRRYPSR